MRTTRQDLERLVTSINLSLNPKSVPSQGFYRLDWDYRQPQLVLQYDGKGQDNISSRLTKGKMREYLEAFVDGINEAQKERTS